MLLEEQGVTLEGRKQVHFLLSRDLNCFFFRVCLNEVLVFEHLDAGISCDLLILIDVRDPAVYAAFEVEAALDAIKVVSYHVFSDEEEHRALLVAQLD